MAEQNEQQHDERVRELSALVERARRHQAALGLSDRDFCDRYREYVGSARQWRYRLLEQKWGEVRLDRMLPKLRALAAQLDGGPAVEEVCEDLPVYERFQRLYRLLVGRKSDRRCMVMLAQSGCGKSVCGRELYRRNPGGVVYMRCRPTWKNRPIRICNGMAAAAGATEGGVADEVFARVVANLKSEPKTVVIDEAHDGGVHLLKLVKTLIDETPSRFVILAFPTLWKRLVLGSDDAHAEAQQLYGRTLKPVFDDYAKGTSAGDIAALLRNSLGFAGEADDVASEILNVARANGNLRLIADVVETADARQQETGETATPAGVVDLCRTYAEKGVRR